MTISRGRVLVVDNQPDWRDMIGGLLLDQGYEVATAEDESTAMRLLEERPYHVAVVDLRLDERDEQDRTGLSLAIRMRDYSPELAIIILTGYADIFLVKMALQPRNDGSRIATDFMEKYEIQRLLSRIELAIESVVRVNPQLDIELSSGLMWDLIRDSVASLRALDINQAQLEIVDLLQRLFHEAERVALHPLHEGHTDGSVILATPYVKSRMQPDVVVRFDETKRTNREARNYEHYVADFVGSGSRTQLLECRATARLGGITYSLIGAKPSQFRRFDDVYRTESPVTLERVLDNLFLETCRAWYTNILRKDIHRQSLGASYWQWLDLSKEELESSLSNFVDSGSEVTLRFVSPSRPFESDIYCSTIDTGLSNPLPLSHAPFFYEGPFAFTHGDLHEGNIFVDNSFRTWLIDFDRTGPAHPARDFALLESAVKFFLQASQCSRSVLFEWERDLLNVASLTTSPFTEPSRHLDPELDKAAQTIVHMRRLLQQVFPSMTLRDYRISLFFHALKATTLSTKLTVSQRQHALFSASILSDILR